MKKIYIVSFLILVAVLFVGTGVFLYKKSEKKPEIYDTAEAFFSDIVKKTVATGTINPRKEVAIKPQVGGIIEKIFVEPGQLVTKGQIIAKIRIIPNVVNLNNAQTQLNTAKINLDIARQEKERQEKLFKDAVISQMDFNSFLLDYQIKKEALEAAENNLQLVKEGASKKAEESTNIVRSTVDGMLLDVPVKEGSFVIESNSFNEGTTIASIADMNEMIFEGKVDESEVGKIKEGMPLLLTIGAIEDEKISANLEFISPKGIDDQGAIKFEIRAAVQLSAKNFIRAGYSANADIVLDKKDSVLAVKESNLLFEDGKIYVEIEKGEQEFEKRELTTGLSDGINIQVLAGLEQGEKIKKR